STAPPAWPPIRSPLPAPQGPTETRRPAGTQAIWSSAPSTVTSADTGSARARATISGPIPRGSPRVIARRGRCSSAPHVDVGLLPQHVQVSAHGQLVPQLLANLVADVLDKIRDRKSTRLNS